MDEQTRIRQTEYLAKLVDRFLELKPEYTGAFWSAEEFAEYCMKGLYEIEVDEMNQWHETVKADPTPF